MVNNWMFSSQLRKIIPPSICFLCESTTEPGHLCCQPCRADFARIQPACPRCGRELAIRGPLCSMCGRHPPEYDCLIAPFHYVYPVSLLIKLLKYKNKIEISRELGLALTQAVQARAWELPEAIVPVPLHPFRTMKRGYNQAREIADVLAARLALPVEADLVRRVRHTQPQFNLDPAQRRRNMQGAFRLVPGRRYRSVAIVDDIVTTGATVTELAKLLRQSGVNRIEVWTCARTA